MACDRRPRLGESQAQQYLTLRRARRSARWDEVRARRAPGYPLARIAREMRMHRRTVRRYLSHGMALVHHRSLVVVVAAADRGSSGVNVRWLCLRPPDQLEPYEHEALQISGGG